MPVTVLICPWSEARERARAIRYTVFVEEQGVPVELEWDDWDEPSWHALALAEDGTPVATGRLLPDGHIGRMAVLAPWRGRGVGSRLLESLIEAARRRGDLRIVLSAQVHAVPFYERHGFRTEGAVYEEAGIPHQAMRRKL